MRAAAALLVGLSAAFVLGGTARADDGRSVPTVLRESDAARAGSLTREIVVLVGGLGSSADDATWDPLVARYASDPAYDLVRFGNDLRFPYDTSGDVETNAAALAAEIRALAGRYRRVHIVTHSMGGAVADASFAQGLGRGDRVRTYVALAAPHQGATLARAAERALELAGDGADVLRAAASLVAHDLDSPAMADLSRRPSPVAPAGVRRLDVRLMTDALVMHWDARPVAGATRRTLAPADLGELEGHGSILSDARTLADTRAMIGTGAALNDPRSGAERAMTDIGSVSLSLAVAAGAALAAIAVALIARRVG